MNNSILNELKPQPFWVISLNDSIHKKWINKPDQSVLEFFWEDLDITATSTQSEIAVTIAKLRPEYESELIQKKAWTIYNFLKLKEGNVILGLNTDSIAAKLGIIEAIEINKENLRFATIIWIENVIYFSFSITISDNAAEILRLNNKTKDEFLKLLDKPKKELESKIMAKNYCYIHGDELLYDNNKKDKGGKKFLFYGTNRNYVGNTKSVKYFGADLSQLSLGYCCVNIPKGHIQGEIERPTNLWFIHFPENSEKHVILETVQQLNEDSFNDWMSKGLAAQSEKSLLLFIHGYNVSFEEAAWRTGQIAWDIPFNGLTGFFSWPSSAKEVSYFADIEKADASITSLEKFVEILITQSGAEKIHIIAHSMGNRVLTSSLNNLSNKLELSEKLKIIHQIVLAAPDLDQDVFRNTILPKFKSIGVRRTIYSSDKDKALNLSEVFRGGRPRVGECGKNIYLDDGIDTIDASYVPSGGNNHSYIFDTKELLSDLFYLIGKGFAPIDRRLREIKKDDLNFWLFPE